MIRVAIAIKLAELATPRSSRPGTIVEEFCQVVEANIL
jgi:hypothetical protein